MFALAFRLQLLAGFVREDKYGKRPVRGFVPDRGGDDPETQDPAAAVSVCSLRGRLHRQNQPGVCGAGDESGTGNYQPAVWIRCRGFFWGYFLFEIPSNLILHKIGARVWIARILITWGAVAALSGFVQSANQLYIARFALGLAEAGYFPGIVLYLGYWFRQREKAQAIALILVGMPLASVLGAPISGFILDHVHWLGLSSWRWLLILEGLPAVMCMFLTYFLLPSRPAEARFLAGEEKAWIAGELEREDRQKLKAQSISVARTLVNPRVWHLACIGFGHGFATYTFTFWLPQIMKSVLGGQSNTVVGFVVMIPNLVGLIAMILVSRHSDRTLERRYHIAASVALAGMALLLLGAPRSAFFSVVLFSAVAIGAYSSLPVFFRCPVNS